MQAGRSSAGELELRAPSAAKQVGAGGHTGKAPPPLTGAGRWSAGLEAQQLEIKFQAP